MMFLGSTGEPVPSSRPAPRQTVERSGGQKRRVLHAAGAEPRAARPFAGEHGEHPPFDGREHAGSLMEAEAITSCRTASRAPHYAPLRHGQSSASGWITARHPLPFNSLFLPLGSPLTAPMGQGATQPPHQTLGHFLGQISSGGVGGEAPPPQTKHARFFGALRLGRWLSTESGLQLQVRL